jgi:hypothetical protein
MAVSHVKSNPVANMTGTVTVFNSAGITTTANATDLVRPTDWNSAHNQFLTLGGNTLGESTLSGTNIEIHGAGNVSVSGNAGTLVIAANAQTVQTQNMVSLQGSTGAIVFSNSNGITFGGNASTMTASHNGLTSQSNQAVSAANGSSTFQTLSFANGNGVTFATGVGGVGASVETSYAASNHSHGNPTLALTNLSGTTASNSAGLTLSLSAAAPGGGGGIAAAAGTQTATSGTINFANSNGMTFGMSGSSQITASYTVPTQTAQTVGVYGVGNTTGQSSSSTIDARSLTIQGAGIASVGMSNGSIIVSAVAAGAGDGGNTLAAGTQSASTNGFVLFENSNGISFGMSGSTRITASHNGLTTARASNDAIGLNSAFTAGPLAMTINSSGLSLNAASAAGTTSGFTGGASISGSMTHNTAGLALSLSHPAWLTTAAQSNHSHGNPTLALTNLSGTTASNSAGLTLSLSAAAPGGAATGTFYATGNTTQSSTGTIALSSVILRGTGGVSAGVSNGSLVVSGPDLTSLSVTGALSASSNGSTISLGVGTVTVSATGNTTQASSGTVNLNALILQGTGGASVGISNGSIVISGATGGGGGGAAISAGANSQNTGTVNFANSNGITFGLSNNGTMTASYNSTQFAGTGTTFAGANISASMTLNSNGLNLSASVAAPGAAAEQNAINLLGANTAGNTTATGSTIGLSGLNLTLSGTNASQIVISAPATSSLVGASGVSISTNGSTISVYNAPAGNMELFELGNNTAFSTMGQGTIYFQQFIPKQNVTFQNIERRFSGSSVSSTNSQVAAHTYSYGLYSRETGASSTRYTQIGASSMYFAASFNSNTQAGWTVSQGAGSVTSTSAGTAVLSAMTGFKHIYFPFAGTVTEGGHYAIAMWMSSATTVGTSPLRIGLMEITNINNLTIGLINTAAGFSISNASRIGDFGQGVYSSSSSNLPSSIAVSGLTNAVSQARMYVQLD